MAEIEAEEQLAGVYDDNYGGSSTPDFITEFPDDKERARQIDRHLGKIPEVDKLKPPDAVIIPVYGDIPTYKNLLKTTKEVIESTLRDFGVYNHTVIMQEVRTAVERCPWYALSAQCARLWLVSSLFR